MIFPTGSYYPSGPSSVNLLFTVTLGRAMNDTAYKSTISIQKIYTGLDGRYFDIYLMLDSKTTSLFKFKVKSAVMNRIQLLTFGYLVVHSTWGDFSGYWLYLAPVLVSVSSISSYTWTNSGLDPIPLPGTIKVFSVLTGFNIMAGASGN